MRSVTNNLMNHCNSNYSTLLQGCADYGMNPYLSLQSAHIFELRVQMSSEFVQFTLVDAHLNEDKTSIAAKFSSL